DADTGRNNLRGAMDEDVGSKIALVTVTLSGMRFGSAKEVTLVVGGGTATEGTDYTIGFELWPRYSAKNAAYVSRLHQKLSQLFKDVLDAHDLEDQVKAARALGAQRAVVMERMFEEGFIVATDIVFTYCYRVPDSEPWNDDIKSRRREAYCEKEPLAYFCPG
ncbi:MAG: hypothetical protein OXP11_15155, partial [Gammaproteobacteria bacterium]|nr:hypothetical protein [Gammaproteobacteria bacterium]